MSRVRSASTVLAIALALSLPVAPAAAAEQVDQQSTPALVNGFFEVCLTRTKGQTFTAGLSGTLTKVVLRMSNGGAPVANLTASIQAVTASKPNATVLATQTLTPAELGAIPGAAGPVTITFTTPATVTAGTQYAIVLSSITACPMGPPSPDLAWVWSGAGSYAGGADAFSLDQGTTWSLTGDDIVFATYVDVASPQGLGTAEAVVPTISLGLQTGGACTAVTAASLLGTWMQLPDARSCSKPGSTLLGWSTSAAFPVDVAKAQVAKGWGVIDGTINGVRMIFIPAGGYTSLTGDNSLYPVWGPA